MAIKQQHNTQHTAPSSELWTITELMQFAKIKSRNTVYSMINEGLPVIKVNRILRFNPESVKSFFDKMEAAR